MQIFCRHFGSFFCATQKKLPKWLQNICITKKCVFNNLKKSHIIIIKALKKIYIFPNQLLYNNMDQAKLAQQLFNLSEDIDIYIIYNIYIISKFLYYKEKKLVTS